MSDSPHRVAPASIRDRTGSSLPSPLGPALALGLALGGCLSDPAPVDAPPPPLRAPTIALGYPSDVHGCRGPVSAPERLVVTSTDFNTGAVGLIDLDTLSVEPDLALASQDAVPVVADGRVFIVNRYGFDWLDELDPDDRLALVHQLAIKAVTVDTSANPHDLVLSPDGDRAWLTLHGAGELQRIRFPTLEAALPHADLALDLREFADADGIPELSMAVGCGDGLSFVSALRIDRSSWTPTGTTLLIPLRADPPAAATLFEFDDAHPGADGIPLLGVGVGPWRMGDDDNMVMLNSGLERIDLRAGTSVWVVDETVFASYGMGKLQLSGFDYDHQGRIWLSVATEDFSSFGLWRVELGEGPEDATLSLEVGGLHSVTGALEIAGQRAFFSDTSIGASGVRVFELGVSPVEEHPASPLAVGLPPMMLTGL